MKNLNTYIQKRQEAAHFYDQAFAHHATIQIPYRDKNSTHVFHQYTLILKNANRNDLKKYLEDKEIPSMIYYPVPLHLQKAYQSSRYPKGAFPITELLCESVLSLPMHTELDKEQLTYIASTLLSYFN